MEKHKIKSPELIIDKDYSDRRMYFRIRDKIPVKLSYNDFLNKKIIFLDANTKTLSYKGFSFFSKKYIAENITNINIEITSSLLPNIKLMGKIIWRINDPISYGVEVKGYGLSAMDFEEYLTALSHNKMIDRRNPQNKRRENLLKNKGRPKKKFKKDLIDKRKIYRRITDLFQIEDHENDNISEKIKFIKRQKKLGYSREAIDLQRQWIADHSGVELEHIGVFSEDPEKMRGNIENMIGVAQVPIGIAGPLKINGQYAKGNFYVPMATTEGTLVYTYTIGMQIVSLAGGVNTTLLKDELHISPIFSFKSLRKVKSFTEWLKNNFKKLKEHAEKTTKHGKLLRIESYSFDRNVVVKFSYSTGDAMGMNMITFATESACQYILPIVKPERFFLHSNFSSIKKVTSHNFVTGYGKTVVAEVIIPRKLIKRIFNVIPEKMVEYYNLVQLSTTHSGMVGMTAHAANAIAAVFTACGQDIANVSNSHLGIINYETTKNGDLYASVKLPNLLVGTVGGGTDIGTQKECLELLGCFGHGKAKKISEIIVATILAGEITLWSTVFSNTFSDAHKKYGKK